MRIAWFSPLPPARTGVAACSAELVDALTRRSYRVDPYPASAAHDFPWRQRQDPYDLIIYQFGNSSHHDYAWPYALRYPGLTVLHDTRLHHARAALLLRERREADYRAEFRANEPDVPAGAAELAIAGFDSRLFYEWPHVSALVERSRCVAVHGEATRRELVERLAETRGSRGEVRTSDLDARTSDRIVSIRLGHGELVNATREAEARKRVRDRYRIPHDAVVFGVFGGLIPEKRIPQILAAFRGLLPYLPNARLLLGGQYADTVTDTITVTGYIPEDELTDHIAAVDVSLNLRWPTARETSGPWLRALAAAKPTVVIDLVHLSDVPSLDPRTWQTRPSAIGHRSSDAVCVAIDILDEDHSLRLAMRRLATDADLRAQLGRAAQDYWKQRHSLDVMVADYERAIQITTSPAHRHPGEARAASEVGAHDARTTRKLTELLHPFGLESPL